MDVDRAMDLYKVYNQVRSDAPTDDSASASSDSQSRVPNVFWYPPNRPAQQHDDIHTFFQNLFKANGNFFKNLFRSIYILLRHSLTNYVNNSDDFKGISLKCTSLNGPLWALLKVFWVRFDLLKHSISEKQKCRFRWFSSISCRTLHPIISESKENL